MSGLTDSLVRIRAQLGLTQDDFAKKLGITRQYLSKLENSSSRPLSARLVQRLADLCKESRIAPSGSLDGIRMIPVKSWAQAGTASGGDFDELPLDWQKQMPTDCPDERAFAVEIQGDSMEPKFFTGDVAVLMPSYQPRNGSLVVAKLEREGVVFKVFTAREQATVRIFTFTSYNPAHPPIDVAEKSVIWNFPVYQTIRQVWR